MILRPETRPADEAHPPWLVAGAGPRPAFAVLWATGPDPAVDGLFRVQALRPAPEAGWEALDLWADPFEGASDGGATARMTREYGASSERLAGAPPPAEAWARLRAFLGQGPVCVAERSTWRAWWRHFEPVGSAGAIGETGPPDEGPAVVALDEVEELLLPGRRPGAATPRSPAELVSALAEVVEAFGRAGEVAAALAAVAYERAWLDLRGSDPELARRLGLALAIVERPGGWARASGELFAGELVEGALAAGRLARSKPRGLGPDELLREDDRPGWSRAAADGPAGEPVPVRSARPTPFDAADRELLDDVFQVHLPAAFAGGGRSGYRAGQHAVARAVAGTLGGDELLLVHAPTGTGKTLAYLVPAVLWAARHGVRVAVSTYTRALQEQAMGHELPRARAALARALASRGESFVAGEERPDRARVSALKGRENYLCWRSLRLHQPDEDDGAEAWLAWARLALYALRDGEGDLDRLAPRPVFDGPHAEAHGRELSALLRSVHARSGCCSSREDRATCAAEQARQRAERSHVVVTNHAFVLASPAAFQHAVFDECEHLHEVAHGAWSHRLAFHEARRALERLHRPQQPLSRAPLDRLEGAVLPGSPAHDGVRAVLAAWDSARRGLEELHGAVRDFRDWREEERRRRDAADDHSLLREYVEGGHGGGLLAARDALASALDALGSGLAELGETLGAAPARGLPRLRRALELARGELAEVREALEAGLPLLEGAPAFRRETFYDVDEDASGREALAARVLLPNEFLGRHYWPGVASGVLLSATTWLRGGFEAARAYLGLDRAAEPLPDEEREPRVVTTFRAPDPFDYRRVVVCVPRDAPSYARQRGAFDEYVRRFVAYLGERTRGRMLVLFTNADDVRRAGRDLSAFFAARRVPFWWQGMPGSTKEELGERFRRRVDSILLGVDTFWFGADFPGETLEYLVIVKLPYGVPDRYHHAQCAALGASEQRRRIYLPRALAKFRQGFGRLMRRETDRGAVFVLDERVLDPRHRVFLRELPLAELGPDELREQGARLVRGETERCLHEALAHMEMLADVRRRGLDQPFAARSDEREDRPRRRRPPEPPERLDLAPEDVPF